MRANTQPQSIDSMPIRAFIDPSEWYVLHEEIANLAEDFPDITGILAIGSLVQSFRPPVDFYDARRRGPLGLAYESVRNPERRKVFPGNNSDLDIWIALSDTKQSAELEQRVSLGGIALLEELASGEVRRGTRRWQDKKDAAFRGYYKQELLYSRAFTGANEGDAPWMARRFKLLLESALLRRTPDFVDRVARFTQKKIPGDFLEIRAFPESVFNLRPDDVLMQDGIKDRHPFPRIADDQWISPRHTSSILFNSGNSTVYPFNDAGRVLGSAMDMHIKQYEPLSAASSYGALLIKPDAVSSGELSTIRDMVRSKIAKFGGRIVLEKMFDPLSYEQVVDIYPALSGQDLEDAATYLSSGRSLGVAIKADMDQDQLIATINEIKGPRVGDRSLDRLLEGRVLNRAIRDLLPLPGDEERYKALIPTIMRRKTDPDYKFTKEEYAYYSRNLVHSPDNLRELKGLLRVIGCDVS